MQTFERKRSGGTSLHPLGKSPNSTESMVNKEAKKRMLERLGWY